MLHLVSGVAGCEVRICGGIVPVSAWFSWEGVYWRKVFPFPSMLAPREWEAAVVGGVIIRGLRSG